MEKEKRHVSLYSAIAIVVANIIGVGVFTSLGFQVQGIKDPSALMMLWLVGGIVALCGALVYGEIGTVFPRSGGEYNYLSKLYSPFVGFLSGWISSTVAFAAPVAVAAMAFGAYLGKVINIDPKILAMCLIMLITAIHATSLKAGFSFQNVFSTIKVLLILAFIGFGLAYNNHQPISLNFTSDTWDQMKGQAFAVSLVYVGYAYSGWNASAYLAGEIKNVKRNLPLSSFIGTTLVILLYLLLTYVFIYTVPIQELADAQAKDFSKPIEVGYFSAEHIFGQGGANIMAIIISLLLVSTCSAMILAGPRVMKAMGEDIKLLKFVSVTSAKGTPYMAVIVQSVISAILIFTASFDQILIYVGFTLQLSTFFTVFGIFIIRFRKLNEGPNSYKTFLYPITPIIFLAVNAWVLYFVASDKPTESMYGVATLGLGAVVYFIDKMRYKN